MFSNHNIWHFLFPIQLKLKENNKYSPRYRGSKFQNFKSPIRGDFGSFSDGYLQLNKQCCGAILVYLHFKFCFHVLRFLLDNHFVFFARGFYFDLIPPCFRYPICIT